MGNKIRVLVADRSASCRAIVFSMLKAMESVEEVKTSANGKAALHTGKTFLPHLVILEWGLPVLTGAETYEQFFILNKDISVLFILEKEEHVGVFKKSIRGSGSGFIARPGETTPETFEAAFSAELSSFVEQTAREVEKRMPACRFRYTRPDGPGEVAATKAVKPPAEVDVILIGVSTGGPEALQKIIPLLPATLPVPVLVVLHIPEFFSKSLTSQLDNRSSLTVKVAEDGDFIRKGIVYFAPGNSHILISRDIHNSPVIRLDEGPKENSCRPSVDPLFRSALSVYKAKRVLCVILTGVGSDGFKGVEFLQRHGGGYCLVQSEKSCVVYGMPRSVAEGGLSCEAVDLELMADKVISFAGCNAMAELSDLLTRSDFNKFRSFLEFNCGISLREDKISFAKARLKSLMLREKARTFNDIVTLCKKSRALLGQVVDLMTTNETLWFRDSHPFRILREIILPELALKGASPVRIWSAACSTGQEPYSVCMEISRMLLTSTLGKSDFEIVGTDISSTAIAKASAGKYDSVAVGRGLSLDYKKKFFRQLGDNTYVVKDEIREMVRFRQFNLKHSYSSLGEFDVVFLRNVLIYFPEKLKQTIISSVARVIKPGGYLFLGASEYNAALDEKFRQIKDLGVYYKKVQ